MVDNSRQGWWQFSLRTAFWLTLLIAVGLAAHRRGFKAGYASGVVEGLNHRKWVGQMYAKAYYVDDLITETSPDGSATPSANALIQNVSVSVLPSTWQRSGGEAAISFYDEKSMLVVNHDQDGHEQITNYLGQLRIQGRKRSTSTK